MIRQFASPDQAGLVKLKDNRQLKTKCYNHKIKAI